MDKKLISIGEAAGILGVCLDTLREWEKEGKITSIKTLGNHRRYRREDIDSIVTGDISEKNKRVKSCVELWSKVQGKSGTYLEIKSDVAELVVPILLGEVTHYQSVIGEMAACQKEIDFLDKRIVVLEAMEKSEQ